jgi:hypothetical protein
MGKALAYLQNFTNLIIEKSDGEIIEWKSYDSTEVFGLNQP